MKSGSCVECVEFYAFITYLILKDAPKSQEIVIESTFLSSKVTSEMLNTTRWPEKL